MWLESHSLNDWISLSRKYSTPKFSDAVLTRLISFSSATSITCGGLLDEDGGVGVGCAALVGGVDVLLTLEAPGEGEGGGWGVDCCWL